MTEFEQMMAEIDVPEIIAQQIGSAATNADVLEMWERLSPAIDEIWGNAPTADCICALAMLLAFTGEKLAMNVKFGKNPEDDGEPVHPNFCIMAIALMAVSTLRASQSARAANETGENDGNETEGKEKVNEDKSGQKVGNGNDG